MESSFAWSTKKNHDENSLEKNALSFFSFIRKYKIIYVNNRSISSFMKYQIENKWLDNLFKYFAFVLFHSILIFTEKLMNLSVKWLYTSNTYFWKRLFWSDSRKKQRFKRYDLSQVVKISFFVVLCSFWLCCWKISKEKKKKSPDYPTNNLIFEDEV